MKKLMYPNRNIYLDYPYLSIPDTDEEDIEEQHKEDET